MPPPGVELETIPLTRHQVETGIMLYLRAVRGVEFARVAEVRLVGQGDPDPDALVAAASVGAVDLPTEGYDVGYTAGDEVPTGGPIVVVPAADLPADGVARVDLAVPPTYTPRAMAHGH
jgi:hypothetical protein